MGLPHISFSVDCTVAPLRVAVMLYGGTPENSLVIKIAEPFASLGQGMLCACVNCTMSHGLLTIM